MYGFSVLILKKCIYDTLRCASNGCNFFRVLAIGLRLSILLCTMCQNFSDSWFNIINVKFLWVIIVSQTDVAPVMTIRYKASDSILKFKSKKSSTSLQASSKYLLMHAHIFTQRHLPSLGTVSFNLKKVEGNGAC